MSGSIGDNVFRASGVVAAAAAGRTGTVDWDTTTKTSTFTATTAEGYFCNTNGGVFTVNLPAGVAGSIVAVADYTRTFNTNNLTITPNGSEKIGGVAASATLNVDGQSATFVYVDGTEGWINIQETQSSQIGKPPFVEASGGTPCTGAIVCTNYKVHTFTGPGTFTVTNVGPGSPCASNKVEYLVVAGGGGGSFGGAGQHTNGAGGAGGYRESPGAQAGCYTVSPRGASPAAAVTVATSPGSYSIVVGSGGAGSGANNCHGASGATSSALCIASAGGGGGGANPQQAGVAGGSGGGGPSYGGTAGGSGNTPPTNPVQGTAGGAGVDGAPCNLSSGGGGGATAVGAAGTAACGGNGGAGGTSCITASPVGRGGGGGGGSNTTGGTATCGGGSHPGTMCGTANKGGGGAGASQQTPSGTGGSGGSGVVVIRYQFQ